MSEMLRKLAVGAVLLFLAATAVAAKDWRGIVPLKSTRADVERLLGVSKQASPFRAFYKLPNEIVVFHFKYQACDDGPGIMGLDWNVAAGTVVGIGVIPRGKHRKEEYLRARNVKVEDNGGDFIYYSDYSAGLSIETYQNLVTFVEYYPRASQNNLRCPKIGDCCAELMAKFDEYVELPFEDVKERLDNFKFQVVALDGRAVLEVVGPSKDRQESLKRAIASREYLVKQLGLEEERVFLVDGGFEERVSTRLYIYSTGGIVSRIHLYPRKDP